VFGWLWHATLRLKVHHSKCVAQVDRHKYVKLAYHGFKILSKEERQAAYTSGTERQSFTGDDYNTIDTLFSLAEVQPNFLSLSIMSRWSGGSARL
jgi:hypothetical protein